MTVFLENWGGESFYWAGYDSDDLAQIIGLLTDRSSPAIVELAVSAGLLNTCTKLWRIFAAQLDGWQEPWHEFSTGESIPPEHVVSILDPSSPRWPGARPGGEVLARPSRLPVAVTVSRPGRTLTSRGKHPSPRCRVLGLEMVGGHRDDRISKRACYASRPLNLSAHVDHHSVSYASSPTTAVAVSASIPPPSPSPRPTIPSPTARRVRVTPRRATASRSWSHPAVEPDRLRRRGRDLSGTPSRC